jgi:HTH-type transcriptional regulator / antitoxin HigA
MKIRPIRTRADYERALARIAQLMNAKPGTAAGDELDVLATLVDVHEARNFPIDPGDPVAAILFRMEQMDLDRKDLEPLIGSRHRVSEVLNRKRGLSIEMIRRLHRNLQIPLEALIGEAA